MGTAASFNKAIAEMQNKTEQITMPYLLLLAEKDQIVCNESAKQWHEKTQSKVKSMKVLPQFYHELCKEPKADQFMYTPILEFCAQQLKNAKPLGEIKPTEFNIKLQTVQAVQ